MYWNYIQLPDETQIAYSDMRKDGTIGIRVERPVEQGFDQALCTIPSYRWDNVSGFTAEEIASLDKFVRNNAPMIYELSQRAQDEDAA